MKKLLMILFVALVSQANTLAQQAEVIRFSPTLAQGYLVLENEYLDVRYWDIEIREIIQDQNGNRTYNTIENIQLIGKNYLAISPEYLENPGYALRVIAHLENSGEDVSQDIVISDVPEEMYGGNPYQECTKWTCNGMSYAFDIKQITDKNTHATSYFKVDIARNAGTPYYAYFPQTVIPNILPSTTVNWPGMAPIPFFQYYDISHTELINTLSNQLQPNNINIICVPFDYANPKFDVQNNIITDPWIYGIAKGLGPWSGSTSNGCMQTGYLSEFCYQGGSGIATLWDAMNMINNYASPTLCGKPLLVCNPTNNGTVPLLSNVIKNCTLANIQIDSVVWISDFLKGVDAAIYGGNYGNWWENYHSISLACTDHRAPYVANVKVADLFLNGEAVDNPIQLPQGLYAIGIMDHEGDYAYLVREVATGYYGTVNSIANQIQVSIFPVPHTENSFQMTITSLLETETNFQYAIYDNLSNRLYSSDMVLAPQATETITISPDNVLPTGLLYHVFNFTDASVKSLCTVKN